MNTICDYADISKLHPEMILTSKYPITWKGFLIIPVETLSARDVRCPRIKLKLIVPNYPSLRDMQVNFGKQIATLRNRQFSNSVKNLLKTASTVSSFLKQLQLIITKRMRDTSSKVETISLSGNEFLHDLKNALQKPSDVRLSCNGSLDIIQLSLKDVSLTLQKTRSTEVPWKIIYSDLPKMSIFGGLIKNVTNLSVAMTKFKWQVELLEQTWKQLKEIDENCWVIDPLEPDKSHMYRRIHLSQSISMTVTIDPVNPTALPVIKFSGTDSEVKRQTNNVSSNIINWDQNCSIVENLKMLLNMSEFLNQQESQKDKMTIIDNGECGICFCLKTDNEELPNKICNNEKCMKHYHSICLSKWLQTIAGNQVVFNHIHGACPHCKENISCPIRQ